jgi:hypothetical protein
MPQRRRLEARAYLTCASTLYTARDWRRCSINDLFSKVLTSQMGLLR